MKRAQSGISTPSNQLLFLIDPAPRGFKENDLVRPAEPNQPIFQTEGKNAATGPTRAASPKADAVDTNEAGAPAGQTCLETSKTRANFRALNTALRAFHQDIVLLIEEQKWLRAFVLRHSVLRIRWQCLAHSGLIAWTDRGQTLGPVENLPLVQQSRHGKKSIERQAVGADGPALPGQA